MKTKLIRPGKPFFQGFVAGNHGAFLLEEGGIGQFRQKTQRSSQGQDLAGWEATYETPLTYPYAVLKLGKSGPFGPKGRFNYRPWRYCTKWELPTGTLSVPFSIHGVTEALKLAFADREAYYGDPDFVKVPLKQLLSREYNRKTFQRDQCPGPIVGIKTRKDLRF
ncbi:MAG: hypothetical protein Ct9H90mP9_4860 [Pseudomonadota bacterium]|nr:MAG: hypothetical protein Ct9H90mP9_4860 [Pseudomonadota bacterium]